MNKNKSLFYIILLIIVIAVIAIISKKIITNINTKEIPFQMNYDISSKPDFYVYNDYIYCCTKDSLKIENSENNIITSDTYTMSYPYMVTNESIVAVTEEKGYEVRIYNQKGLLYEILSDDPVLSVSVNNKGTSCVISKANNMYKFCMYKPLGNGEYKRCIYGELPEEQTVPFASTVDNNSDMFALSVIQLDNVRVNSNVCFYYYDENNTLNEESASDDNCMIASYTDSSLIGIMKFLNKNCFISISENNMACHQFDIKSSEKRKNLWSVDFKNKITAVDFVNNKYIAVAYGDKTTVAEGSEASDSVVIYDLNGKRIGAFKADRSITQINSYNNIIICISGRTIYCIDETGNELWNYTHSQDILSSYPFLNKYHTFIASDTEAKIYTMPYSDKTKVVQEDTKIEETTETSTSKAIKERKSKFIIEETTTGNL